MDRYKIYPKQFKNEKITIEKNKCFMLMQFSEDLDIIYGTIKDALNKDGYLCARADDISGSSLLLNKIIREILSSRFIIVDLTHNNPNVFYELGIAHSFKDPSNIILIKQEKEKCPFDISHLTYIEYSPDNLILLVSKIKNHINSNRYLTDFYEMLNVRGIINLICDNQEEFVEYIQNQLGNDISILTETINNSGNNINIAILESLFQKFEDIIKKTINNNYLEMISGLLNIYYELIVSCSALSISEVFVNSFINTHFNLTDELSWKTDLIVKLSEKKKMLNICMPWIMEYFSKLHVTTIDLNRYKLEKFLMTTNYTEVNESMTNALFSEYCYLREHMANIIGEKRIVSALSSLYSRLEIEENCYVIRSMVRAIGKIDNISGIDRLLKWFSERKDSFIEQKYFSIFKHMYIAISHLDTSEDKRYITYFESCYKEYLNK